MPGAFWFTNWCWVLQTSDEFFPEKQALGAENHGKFLTNKSEEILMEFLGKFSLMPSVWCARETRRKKAIQTKTFAGKRQHHHNMFYLFLIHVQRHDRNGRSQSNIYLIQASTNRVRSSGHAGGWKNPWRGKARAARSFYCWTIKRWDWTAEARMLNWNEILEN